MKFLHLNIRGLLCNLPSLQYFFNTYKNIDIFAVSETHIDQDTSNLTLYNITGYDFVSKNRQNGLGGGVGVYVKSDLIWKRRSDLESKSTEIFQKHTKSILVGCYYRPPISSKYLPKNFNNDFNETLINCQKEQKEVILLGDFNANYLKKTDSKDIKSIIETNGFD